MTTKSEAATFHRDYQTPGVNVKNTIFGDLGQFSAKKWQFVLKINVTTNYLHKIAAFWVKIAFFSAKLC
jgi:hypothetical protein